ncbi:MAG: hypothetical protein CMH83_09620 [Nocardioides sp.]|nr:hypothetical protein [Nocardioides sp.]
MSTVQEKEQADVSTDHHTGSEAPRARGSAARARGVRSSTLVLVVAVLAAGSGVWWLLQQRPEPGGTPPTSTAGGEAYVGGSLPGDLAAPVAAAVQTVPLALTYDYRDLQAGLKQATGGMTDEFAAEFRTTFQQSAGRLARSKQAVTDATVKAAGVVRQEDDDHVVVLLYVDQVLVSATTLADPDQPVQVSQNRVLAGLERGDDGTWRVDSISPR